jgi:hypothetical protein
VRSTESSPRAWGVVATSVALMVGSAGLLAWTQPRVAARFHGLRAANDTYALPEPEQTRVASLGYRSALADLLFAEVLVSYGLHFEEHRAFEYVGSYLDTITTLDPKFRAPYYVADTLLTLQAQPPTAANYSKARQLLERGMAELPYDSRLWLQSGQFLAYLGPAHFTEAKEKQEWRLAGARRLARACELLSEDDQMPFQCITAAGLLSREGEIDAMVRFLERIVDVSDNEEIHALALGLLRKRAGEQDRLKAEGRWQRFRDAWGRDLRFVSKDQLLVLGPAVDTARCAGSVEPRAACATTWVAWTQSE